MFKQVGLLSILFKLIKKEILLVNCFIVTYFQQIIEENNKVNF